MNTFLRQSSASQSRAIGPFLDDTDFKTAETGLTIANTDIKLVANGGSSANKNSGGGTHRVNGVYGVTFDATDTATVGELFVSVVVAGALPVFHTFFVLEEAVYDALFAASALGYVANAPVNVAQFGGNNGTFASGRPEVNTTHFGGSSLTQSGGRPEVNTTLIEGSDATNQIRDSVVDDATRIDASALNTLSGHDPGETIMGATDLGTGAGLTALATAVALDTLDTLVDAIKAKTDNLPSDPADQSLIIAATDAVMARLGAPAGASVSADIAAVKSDTAAILTDTGTTLDGKLDAIQAVTDKLDDTLEDDGGTFRFTGNALEEAPAGGGGGGGPTAEEIRIEIDANSTQIAAIKAKTDGLPSDPADASAVAGLIAGVETKVDAVDAVVDGIKAKTDLIPAAPAAVGDIPTAAQNRAEMDSNSTKLASIDAKTTNLPSDPADQSLIIAATDAVMNRLGAPAGASVSADVAAVKSDTAEILVDTGATLDGKVDGIKAKTDLLPASPAATGDAMTLTEGERNAIADAHLDRENGIEPGLTPRGAHRLVAAAAAGKLSGAETTTAVIRNAVADSKDRIVATVDADGNRSAVTTDVT